MKRKTLHAEDRAESPLTDPLTYWSGNGNWLMGSSGSTEQIATVTRTSHAMNETEGVASYPAPSSFERGREINTRFKDPVNRALLLGQTLKLIVGPARNTRLLQRPHPRPLSALWVAIF